MLTDWRPLVIIELSRLEREALERLREKQAALQQGQDFEGTDE